MRGRRQAGAFSTVKLKGIGQALDGGRMGKLPCTALEICETACTQSRLARKGVLRQTSREP
jgi:hypothetical protein